ncbi:tRNA pseudouridine(55) synthase TruB [Nocardioides sp. Y6]|uniref:tRNA pseudouridine synthase B n=1 Tax=Nocardioides malaquae TaxID=2773426 RepID=A0ABR9RPK8_9ACTN|nr:tRNA pseudouridine(55) synthase TruB [Nocardioides malaquae]MBE7323330.1 tRNA pseudouridine(55) synthase TruB [Nocardioides malaquae]
MSSSAAPSGLVVVDKPGGLTSHAVVARVRRLAGTRKVGHAGTLDPMATGVLVLGTNRATRLLGHLMLTRKTYEATAVLGVATTTDDAEGEVTATTSATHLSSDEVREALAAFVGEIDQVPTAVSAIKVDGKRAYARVRDGEEVVLKPRRVTIDSLEVHRVEAVGETTEVDFTVRCSSGTYIRAIARDLGAVLGVGGHLSSLRRTAVGEFDLRRARTLEQLEEHLDVVPIEEAARATFPTLELTADDAAAVRFGRRLDLAVTELTAVFSPEGDFLALYEPHDGGAKPVAVFVQ